MASCWTKPPSRAERRWPARRAGWPRARARGAGRSRRGPGRVCGGSCRGRSRPTRRAAARTRGAARGAPRRRRPRLRSRASCAVVGRGPRARARDIEVLGDERVRLGPQGVLDDHAGRRRERLAGRAEHEERLRLQAVIAAADARAGPPRRAAPRRPARSSSDPSSIEKRTGLPRSVWIMAWAPRRALCANA